MCNIFRRNTSQYSTRNEYSSYLNSIENPFIRNYIEQRVLGQIDWYDRKSMYFQKQFKYFTIISLFLSSSIPVISLFKTNTITKIAISIISSFITIITGILSLYKSKELWLQYRNSCESLKSILHQYFTQSGMFAHQNSNQNNTLLIQRCESIITSDIKEWLNLNTTTNNNHN